MGYWTTNHKSRQTRTERRVGAVSDTADYWLAAAAIRVLERHEQRVENCDHKVTRTTVQVADDQAGYDEDSWLSTCVACGERVSSGMGWEANGE